MVDVVVCDDVDDAFKDSGESARLGAAGPVTIYDRVAETPEELL